MKLYAIQILVLLGLSQTASADTCHPFMPDTTTIQGTLTVETLGEKPESVYFLNLVQPICLAPKEGDKVSKAVASISKIQLRSKAADLFEKLKPHLKGEVKCTGAFFGRHMPIHHTEVLLWIQECTPLGQAV
jgi:hypothetical protein